MSARKVIYKITYPNGKIYVGQDLTDSPNYFGSAKTDEFRADFTQQELDNNFTVSKSVIWSSMDASKAEVSAMERSLIVELGANDPSKGYNRWPKWRTP
jgi:hypothetical protein